MIPLSRALAGNCKLDSSHEYLVFTYDYGYNYDCEAVWSRPYRRQCNSHFEFFYVIVYYVSQTYGFAFKRNHADDKLKSSVCKIKVPLSLLVDIKVTAIV